MNAEFNNVTSYLHIDEVFENQSTQKSINKLIDFDANLFHKDIDFKSATERAHEKGVRSFVVPGSTLEDSAQVIAAAQQFSCIVAATAGVHPYNAEAIVMNEDNILSLRRMLASQYCLAVGECGLDFSPGFPPPSFQVDWFRTQVALAIEHDKPLYLHLRKAHQCVTALLEEETVASLLRGVKYLTPSRKLTSIYDNMSLREYIQGGCLRCVVHCFTGTLDELRYFVELGCYIGFTGYVFSLPEESAREMLQMVPWNRLVIETDAPYMGFKGCRESEENGLSRKYPNVPAALPKVAIKIAELLAVSYDELCTQTAENSLEFFQIAS